MTKLVAMLIICFVPQPNGTLKEAWRIEQTVTLEHCLVMNQVAAQGGRLGAIIVRCDPR